MDFSLSDEQELLQHTVQGFVAKQRVMFDRLWLGAPELHRERFAALEGW
jgi:hypothetical protein